MRDLDPAREAQFFALFQDYFNLESDAGKQHDIANYTIERMAPLAEIAGNPERRLKILHIAGTKGKGSTCYYLGALLNAAGKSCGIFTSPHLDTVRERFQINGELASYDELIRLGAALVDGLRARDLHPSLFEIFTLLALQLFDVHGVDYAILETGIGGTLDATNYIDQKLAAVITPLSFDHTALLGNTIQKIAAQKAGILRFRTPVILSRQPFPDGEAAIIDAARRLDAPLYRPLPDGDQGWLPPETPAFLRENFQTARRVLEVLGLTPRRDAFRAPLLRARFELLRRNPPVIIDAAHNADSMQRLVADLRRHFPNQRFLCVLGSVAGKDITGICQALRGLDADFILTDPDTPRASARPQLEAATREAGLAVRASVHRIDSAADLPADTPILFTGSFFTATSGERLFPVVS